MACVDFVSQLPPEISLQISTYLTVEDVLKWLRVCKNWYAVLNLDQMSPFWRRACVNVGFPKYYIEGQSHPNQLYHEALDHRVGVKKVKPEIHSIGGIYPWESTQKCEYAGNGFFIKTVDYSSLQHEEVVVGVLAPDKKTIVNYDTYKSDAGSIYSARYLNGDIFYECRGPKWFRYDTRARKVREIKSLKMERRINSSSIGTCRNCMFLALCGTENSLHGYTWHMIFANYNNGREKNPLELKHKVEIPSGVTQYIPRPLKAHIFPENGSCESSHILIIQGGSGACVYRITHNEEEGLKISPKHIAMLNPFYDINVAVMVVNTTSTMTLSQDGEVLGLITCIVYPFKSGLKLHVFDTRTYERISDVKVKWADGFNDCEVLAVSRLYAVLAVGHSKGIVKLAHCKTGQILHTIIGLSRGLPPVVPMSRLVLCHYEGMYGEDCMVDVRKPFTLVVLYRKGVNNIDGIWFTPFPEIPPNRYIAELSEESEDDRDD